MTTTTEFITTKLALYTPVKILEEEIDDRRRDKRSKSEFSSVILEAGLLSYQEKIIMLMTSVVPSGLKATNQTPRSVTAPEAVEATTATTTTKEEEAAVQAV